MSDSVTKINKLFYAVRGSTDLAPARAIRARMSKENIAFDELNFTEEELKAAERQACINYINILFADEWMYQREKDHYVEGNYIEHIRSLMREYNIDFDEAFNELDFIEEELCFAEERLRFAEEELEAEEQKHTKT